MLKEQLKNPGLGKGKRVRLDANSIPTTMPSEIKVPTSEEAYTNLVSELFPHGAPKLGDVFTIPGSQAPPPSEQVEFALTADLVDKPRPHLK